MKIKVRLTTFARNDSDLLNRLTTRYNSGSVYWKDIEFVSDDSYDKLVIFTYPHKTTLESGYNESKAITFMTEPTLSYYAKSHPTSEVINAHLPLPFFPKEIFGETSYGGNGDKIEKVNLLSCVTSELWGMPGHNARLQFISSLDKAIDGGIDIYGRFIKGKFFNLLSQYKGSLSDKYEGLWSYYYHFACENSFENGYFTEKLLDPIIAETLCFYDGCPDIENYIDNRAYVKISVHDFEESFHTICESVNNNLWEERLPYIRKEKLRFLTELHPFNFIWMAVNEMDVLSKVKIN